LTVTVFAQKRMFFDFSKSDFITCAAVGAQLPFSMKPTVRIIPQSRQPGKCGIINVRK